MRILHTADWHLGHRLYDRDRTPEHRAALAWLLDLIEAEQVDLLVVAGDVFDVTNPSNQARELYYDFLGQLAKTKCLGAVIVGGNHDSPSMLDAPRDLMRSLNLHVIGAARTRVQEQVLQIAGRGNAGVELIVAAVPYLRERDIRKAKFGETAKERVASLQAGISGHYRAVAEAALASREVPATPILATGHLFAGGASDHDEKKSYIYQADEHNIDGGQFPDCFDYVALGHIHRAQKVGGQEHIRYSGSLVPLTFVEGQRGRSVRIVDLGKAGEAVTSRPVNVPYFRTLLRLNDELPAVQLALRTAVVAYQAQLSTPAPAPISNTSGTSDDGNHLSNIANRQSHISNTSGTSDDGNHLSNIANRQSPISNTSGTSDDGNHLSNIANRQSHISNASGTSDDGNRESRIENRESRISNASGTSDDGNQESRIENREHEVLRSKSRIFLPPWAEVRIKTDEKIPNLRQVLLDSVADLTEDGASPPVELLMIRQERLTPAPASAPPEKRQLDELDPEEVFTGIVTTDGASPERATELLADFRALRNWMNDEPA